MYLFWLEKIGIATKKFCILYSEELGHPRYWTNLISDGCLNIKLFKIYFNKKNIAYNPFMAALTLTHLG